MIPGWIDAEITVGVVMSDMRRGGRVEERAGRRRFCAEISYFRLDRLHLHTRTPWRGSKGRRHRESSSLLTDFDVEIDQVRDAGRLKRIEQIRTRLGRPATL